MNRKIRIAMILIGFASILAMIALIIEFWAYMNGIDLTYYMIPLEILIWSSVGFAFYLGAKDETFGIMMGLLIFFFGIGILVIETNLQAYISKELLAGNMIIGIVTLALIWVYYWYKVPIKIKAEIVEVELISE